MQELTFASATKSNILRFQTLTYLPKSRKIAKLSYFKKINSSCDFFISSVVIFKLALVKLLVYSSCFSNSPIFYYFDTLFVEKRVRFRHLETIDLETTEIDFLPRSPSSCFILFTLA